MLNAQFDPLTGLPTKKTPTLPKLGPGPAEPKSPALGGYGASSGVISPPLGAAPTVAGDPVSGAPSIPTATGSTVAGPASPQDLEAMLQNDPFYKQTQADVQASTIADQASRAAARQRALVQFGRIPDLSSIAGALGLVGSDIGGDITDTTRQLAQQNTSAGLSTVGKLQQANSDAVRNIKDQLAARGILSSGETGYQLGRQNQSFTQAQYDAMQQLIDYLASVQSGYLTNQQSLRAQLQAALENAASRITADQAALPPQPQQPQSPADVLASLPTLAPILGTMSHPLAGAASAPILNTPPGSNVYRPGLQL